MQTLKDELTEVQEVLETELMDEMKDFVWQGTRLHTPSFSFF